MIQKLDYYLSKWSGPLLIGMVLAVWLANYEPLFYRSVIEFQPFGHGLKMFGHLVTLQFLVNDVFMAFFFGLAAKEIREAMLPGGSLNPLKSAINPLMATLGGVLGPAVCYSTMTLAIFGQGHEVANGWGIPTATDIALAWLAAKLIFGERHPAVQFLLLLAVADDGIGLAIIAVFYPDPLHPVNFTWLILLGLGMFVAWFMSKRGVNNWLLYVVIPGSFCWAGLLLSSLHPALALVFVVPWMPHDKTDEGMFADLDEVDLGHRVGPHSALHQLEHATKKFVERGMFLFAFLNAGVQFGEVSQVTTVVLTSLIVGKTVGIFLYGLLAQWLGFRLPQGMGWRELLVAGIVAGMGLTVALFVSAQAFPDGSLFQGPAKMGALGSMLAAPLAFMAAKALGVKKWREKEA